MLKKFMSLLIAIIFATNSIAYADESAGQVVFQTIYQQDILAKQLAQYKIKYDNLKSWKDVTELAKDANENDRVILLGNIKRAEKNTFRLPDLLVTPTGFMMENHQ
jgi:ABC-type glycerol-3-phosphate transport system substrate-binding protein